MDFKKKRWICFIAGLIIISCNGFQYGLSVFQIQLSQRYGWSITETAAAFSVMSIIEFFAVLFLSNKLRKWLGFKKFMMVGGILFALGILGCAFIQKSTAELYLYQGVFIGIGNAMIYPGLTAYIIRIFPEKSGFANGMTVACFACGPVIWAPFSAFILDKVGNVSLSFAIIGTSMLILLVIMTLLLFEPPKSFILGISYDDIKKTDINASIYDVDIKGMVAKTEFYMFYIIFALGIFMGTMILTQGATIAELGLGFTAAGAAAVLAGLNIGNAVGRLAFGTASDKVGTGTVVQIMFAIYLAVFFLMLISNNRVVQAAVMIVSMLAFGGFCALLAPTTKKLFGISNLNENFNLVYTAYAIGGIGAPVLVARIRDITGSYSSVYIIEIILSVVGMVCAFFFRKKTNNI